jgi:hypothetical protein
VTTTALVNALLYQLTKWLIERKPAFAFHPLIIRLLAWCRPDWEQWKVNKTMESVDKQAVALVEQWEQEEKKDEEDLLVAKAKALFPEATVEPIEAAVPSVMILHDAPPDASDVIKALGGEMRIASSFSIDNN